METLYMKWVEGYKDSPKMNNVFDAICNGKSNAEINKKYDMLAEAVNEERETAFNAGFRTAVQLFCEGLS